MTDNRKYYYLKFKENFFDSEAMIILESMQDGYLYSNILIKLYLRSLKNQGKLMFNNTIPYNSNILSQVVRHNVGVVEKALNIFRELGLIELLDNGAIFMLDIQNYIGQSSSEADRQRNYQKLIKKERAKLPDKYSKESCKKSNKIPNCITNIEPNGIPTPKIEIEIKTEIEKKIKSPTNVIDKLIIFYNSQTNTICKITKTLTNNIKTVLKEFSIDECKLVIQYIISEPWYVANNQTSIDVIFRPTKFGEKYNKALIAKQKALADRFRKIELPFVGADNTPFAKCLAGIVTMGYADGSTDRGFTALYEEDTQDVCQLFGFDYDALPRFDVDIIGKDRSMLEQYYDNK